MIAVAWIVAAASAAEASVGSPQLTYRLLPPQVKTYPVVGLSFEELVEACRQNGPTDPDGRKFPGLTRYAFRYQYRYDYTIENGQVVIKLTDLSIDWTHEVVLPTLAPGLRLPLRDAARWKRFIEQLQAHEAQHVEITSDPRLKGYFETMTQRARVLSKPLAPSGIVTPDEIQQVVDQALKPGIQQISAQIARKNREFDLLTAHGTQPAGFDKSKFFAELWDGF